MWIFICKKYKLTTTISDITKTIQNTTNQDRNANTPECISTSVNESRSGRSGTISLAFIRAHFYRRLLLEGLLSFMPESSIYHQSLTLRTVSPLGKVASTNSFDA